MRLTPSARAASTTGSIVNLMSIDAYTFTRVMMRVFIVVFSVIKIIIALAMLWQTIGMSAIAGFAVLAASITVNSLVSRKLRTLQVSIYFCPGQHLFLSRSASYSVQAKLLSLFVPCAQIPLLITGCVKVRPVALASLWAQACTVWGGYW